jgi:hypothetical protein
VRTFAQKQPQKQVASGFARSNTAIPGLNHTTSLQPLQRTIDGKAIQRLPQTNAEELDLNSTGTAASCYAHDFSGIPVHAQRPTGAGRLIQRRTTGDTHVETAPPNTHEVLRSSGLPLDTATRAFMEPRFGHDFSRVRVHLDSQAAASARDVGALAYTVGRDIVFSQDQFAPYSAAGQQLLAHELAHTVQQSAGGDPVITGQIRVGTNNDPLEREAERVSSSALSGPGKIPSEAPPAAVLRSDGGPTLRRQPKPAPHRPETQTKKEEGGEKTSTPTAAPCKLPGKPLPCTPKGLSIDEFLKKNPPRDALGITRYGPQKFPNPEVKTKGKDKVFVINETKAAQISCESFFAKADDKKTISRTSALDAKDPKQEESAKQCGGHYSEEVRIFPDGEDRIREAEMEHCTDYRYAFDISLGCYADVVNDFAETKKKKGTPFTSPEAAVEAVTKRVGLKPDVWVKRYFELLDKSNDRDTNGWHTAVKSGPLQLSVKGRQCQSDFPNEIKRKSYPEVGKHPKEEVIK